MEALPVWSRAELGPREFTQLAALVYETCGIALAPHKRTMLEGRLRRRLQARELGDFREYVRYLANPELRKDELQPLIDAVTTNQTAFFREPAHFEFLASEGLRHLREVCEHGRLRAWSSASSTGEEPYTIAMVLAEHWPALSTGDFSVYATDISSGVLQRAVKGIYQASQIDAVPEPYRSRYFMRARDPDLALARVVPELRRQVTFARLNLIEPTFRLGQQFELIFCRNVLIYFDPETQERVLQRLCDHLQPGGLLCLGHADTTAAYKLPLRALRANIHMRV